jgi:hypothetical protein
VIAALPVVTPLFGVSAPAIISVALHKCEAGTKWPAPVVALGLDSPDPPVPDPAVLAAPAAIIMGYPPIIPVGTYIPPPPPPIPVMPPLIPFILPPLIIMPLTPPPPPPPPPPIPSIFKLMVFMFMAAIISFILVMLFMALFMPVILFMPVMLFMALFMPVMLFMPIFMPVILFMPFILFMPVMLFMPILFMLLFMPIFMPPIGDVAMDGDTPKNVPGRFPIPKAPPI